VNLAPRTLVSVAVLVCLASCHRSEPPRTDREVRPVTIKGVHADRVTFYSSSLGRRKQYLVVRPENANQLEGFGVIYLLHGFGGEPADWLRWSHLHDYLRNRKLIAVLPEGDNSYYVNAAEVPEDHYADYIANDVPNDVETHYPVAAKRESRLIGGLSMGGYGAFYLGLKHPDRYWFVGSMSNAADAPTRKFSFERFGQYWRLRKIFGPPGSGVREDYDPFYLVKSAHNPKGLPYIYLACGNKDSLLGVNRLLDRSLAAAHIDHVYRETPGAHNWRYWDQALKGMFDVMDKVSPEKVDSTVSLPAPSPQSPQPPASASAPSHHRSSP
jgi:putative tributyrin esterase